MKNNKLSFCVAILAIFTTSLSSCKRKYTPCTLYFNQDAGIRFRWAQEENRFLTVDCLQIDDEIAKKEEWDLSYTFNCETLPISKNESISLGRIGKSNLVDNEEACYFDRAVGYPNGVERIDSRAFALRAHYFGTIPSTINLSFYFPIHESLSAEYLELFHYVIFSIWWLKEDKDIEEKESHIWPFDRNVYLDAQIAFNLSVYLWDNYNPILENDYWQKHFKDKYYSNWNGNFYTFSKVSSEIKFYYAPSFDKPYPFED